MFLDQVHANVIGGFVANKNIPDPNFGKCLQCAAIDRARYQSNPPVVRSDFCSQCFKQYCYDPHNPPSSSELPGRKLNFVDPDPQGMSGLLSFLSRSELGIILGFIGATLVIAAISAFLCVSPLTFDIRILTRRDAVWFFLCRLLRERRQKRAAEYHKAVDLHDGDEPPFLLHMMQRESGKSESYGSGHVQDPYVPEEHR
jgi:lysophospholipase